MRKQRKKKSLDGRKLSHDTLEEIRERAVRAVQGGEHPETVAKALGLGVRSVFNWLAAYRAGGWGALKAKKLNGRPRKLEANQIKRLYRLIVGSSPLQYRTRHRRRGNRCRDSRNVG